LASDQTPKRYREMATTSHRGTGVFLRTAASGETLVTLEQNLSYEVCVRQGQSFVAFKWIPAAVASFAQVGSSRCRLVGERCTDSCDADGCLCNPARQQCVDASGNSQMPPNTGGRTSGDEIEPALVDMPSRYASR
jgi:hypothetical protein